MRELENIVERAVIVSRGSKLSIGNWFGIKKVTKQKPMLIRLQDIEKEHIKGILISTNWRVRGENGAADILGLKPTTLESKMKKLGIHRKK